MKHIINQLFMKQNVLAAFIIAIGASTVLADWTGPYQCTQFNSLNVDNLGYNDSCRLSNGNYLTQTNCNQACGVYSGLPPGSYCTTCSGIFGTNQVNTEESNCQCITGIPQTCNYAPGACTFNPNPTDSAPDPCYCKFSGTFPPPPLDPAEIDNCGN